MLEKRGSEQGRYITKTIRAPQTVHWRTHSSADAAIAAQMARHWGVVQIDALGPSPVVSVLLDSEVTAGCLWEVRPFHYHLCSVGLSRWLRGGPASPQGGCYRVDELAEEICPGMPCQWFPSQKQAASMSVIAGKRKREPSANRAVGSERMATSGWILAYILLWSCNRKGQGKAYSLLQGIIRSVCKETLLEGSSIAIKDGVVCDTGDNDMWTKHMRTLRQIIKNTRASITRIVAKDMESPPALAAVLWTLSMELHRDTPDMLPSQGRQMLRELSNIIITTVASAMDMWARTALRGNVSTATLLQTHLRGKARPRRVLPILKHRLAQKRRPQAAVATWKDDGVNITISPEATMLGVCSRYVHKVQQTMTASTTIELLMDASRFGGTDNEIFVIFSPSQNIAGYAPPQA